MNQLQDQRQIHAIQVHVEISLNVDQLTIVHHAHAYQITLDLHQIADLNALSIPIVHRINHALLNVVAIHAKDHAVSIRSVAFKIIFQFALAEMVSLVIRSHSVLKSTNHQLKDHRHIARANQIHVVAMLCVTTLSVLVSKATMVIRMSAVDQNVQ